MNGNNERIDDLQFKGLKIIQNSKCFCFGIDAVLLANFAQAADGETVADLGTGTGIIPILMAGKTCASMITGIEIQDDMVEMARRSVALNRLEHRIEILSGDIRNLPSIFKNKRYDAVTVNPPYMIPGRGLVNPEEAIAIARHELKCSLSDILAAAAIILKPGGRFYMVHRPERLADIMCEMRNHKVEPKLMRMVHPSAGRSPNLVLVHGVKGGNSFLKVMPPLYVYNDNGCYTDEINTIYGR